jgi:hypothetical protein
MLFSVALVRLISEVENRMIGEILKSNDHENWFKTLNHCAHLEYESSILMDFNHKEGPQSLLESITMILPIFKTTVKELDVLSTMSKSSSIKYHVDEYKNRLVAIQVE